MIVSTGMCQGMISLTTATNEIQQQQDAHLENCPINSRAAGRPRGVVARTDLGPKVAACKGHKARPLRPALTLGARRSTGLVIRANKLCGQGTSPPKVQNEKQEFLRGNRLI